MIRITFLTLAIFAFNVAFCCDCYIATFETARDSSEAVFTGTVIKIVDDPRSCYNGYCIAVYVTLKVNINIKGGEKEIVIHTMKNPASCGFPFEMDKEYLVYADLTEFGYRTGLCSRTMDLDNSSAQSDLKKLKK